MVCGAIVVAVAIEVIVAHPTDAVHLPSILIAIAGPLIFLVGNMLFRRTLGRRIPPSYLAPFMALPLIGWAVHAIHASGLLLGLGMLLVILPVAIINPDRPSGTTP
jgi:low temperature requirement protein LtrA